MSDRGQGCVNLASEKKMRNHPRAFAHGVPLFDEKAVLTTQDPHSRTFLPNITIGSPVYGAFEEGTPLLSDSYGLALPLQ
jgi:hypothetical protein